MVFLNIKLSSMPRNVQQMLSVISQLLQKVSVALKINSLLLNVTMKDSSMMHLELLETDLVLPLKATSRGGKRSTKTEQTPSNLLQRQLAAMLIKLYYA